MTHLIQTIKKHTTIAKFAKLSGIDRTTIYKQLRYGFIPRDDTIEIYAKTLSKLTKKDWRFHQKLIQKEIK